VKLTIVTASLYIACVAFAQVKPAVPSTSQTVDHADQKTRMIINLSNVSKDPDENYGHGHGDSLTLIIRGETAVGALSELEGSQLDPTPICMTGTLRNGFLTLNNHPEDLPYDVGPISIRGKLYPIAHGHAFRGRIVGGPFHAPDAKSTDPHFPAIVTLRKPHDEFDSDQAADALADDSCACQWKKRIALKNFVSAECGP
jgi:hypothetical protein